MLINNKIVITADNNNEKKRRDEIRWKKNNLKSIQCVATTILRVFEAVKHPI